MRDRAGSAAAPAARCRNRRRGSFMMAPPPASSWSTSSLSNGDEHIGEFLRPVHHHVVAAGDADELPTPIILEASAELLERRRLPPGGKNVHALWHLPATQCELLLECC